MIDKEHRRPSKGTSAERQAREAEALRDNLARRKAQTRARGDEGGNSRGKKDGRGGHDDGAT